MNVMLYHSCDFRRLCCSNDKLFCSFSFELLA
uniref:Uncharacterized protein n=1 Tax=Arundo donax TaxID=35708 RepID=A0A0A9HVT8_ARUDO